MRAWGVRLLLFLVSAGAQPEFIIDDPWQLRGAPMLRGAQSQSSSWSSSSSWVPGSDAKMHQQVQQVREEVSDNGRGRNAQKAAIACIDGHCKGVVQNTVPEQPMESMGGMDMGDMVGMGDMDGMGGMMSTGGMMGLNGMDRMNGLMDMGMMGGLGSALHGMDRMAARMARPLIEAEQVAQDQKGNDAHASEEGRDRPEVYSKSWSMSRSSSMSKDGPSTVVQTTKCENGRCEQETKRYEDAPEEAQSEGRSDMKDAAQESEQTILVDKKPGQETAAEKAAEQDAVPKRDEPPPHVVEA